MVNQFPVGLNGLLILLLGCLQASCTSRQESPEELIAWLNQEVPSDVIQDIRIDYRLEYRGLDRNSAMATQFYMVIRGTSPEARNVVGSGIAAYFKHANEALATKQLMIEGGYVSDSPILKKDLGVITWEQPLWIIPARKK